MTNTRDEGDSPHVIPLSLDGSGVLSVEPRQFSGWAAYFSDEVEKASARVFLRLGLRGVALVELPDQTPLEIRELRVVLASGANLRSSVLRSVPQDRIEAAINQPQHRRILAKLVLPGSMVADDLPGEHGAWIYRPPRQEFQKPDLQLEIPDGYRKPDEFYSAVGELFQQMAAVSSRAAQEIAEANDVKPTTVHRWIREAKARGLLIHPAS